MSWTGIPVSFAAPSVHSASNHPLPSRCAIWRFLTSGLPSNAPLKARRVLTDQASWVSPFTGRLTTARGRIEFVSDDRSHPVLRTGRSPPVAPHPASQRRSYHRLRGTRHPSARTFTSPMQQHYRRTSTTLRVVKNATRSVAPHLATPKFSVDRALGSIRGDQKATRATW